MKLALAALVTLAVSLTLALPLAAAPSRIEGTWELVSAAPRTVAESDPRGLANHKLYFTAGTVYLIAPDAKLTKDTAAARYEFDGKVRKVTFPDGTVKTNATQIDGDTMTVMMYDGEQLTYRRLTGERAYDRELPPISVELVATDEPQTTIREPKYDTTDYSKRPVAERVRGVWEVVRYRHIATGDVPPYGFPNDKYVISEKAVSVVPPAETRIDAAKSGAYRVSGQSLIVDGESWSVSFDRWGRLVLTRKDAELTLRLIQKSTATIPQVPVKIALLDFDEDGATR